MTRATLEACGSLMCVVDVCVAQVMAFNSIPFASPPKGQLRFAVCVCCCAVLLTVRAGEPPSCVGTPSLLLCLQPPVPPEAWPGVKDVSADPDICPQIKLFNLDVFGSEDCLYLHVYVPDHDPTELLPVMFWSTCVLRRRGRLLPPRC